MFITRLTISSLDGVLRNISFHDGLNLIVDETPDDIGSKATGNNVGKTTVLRLIDYCLGGDKKKVYADPENKAAEYSKVREYLESREVEVELELSDRIGSCRIPGAQGRSVVIRKNFLTNSRALRTIDGERVKAGDWERVLAQKLLPSLALLEKPTFRQVIAHNIRVDDLSLTRTFKYLHQNTTGVQYESLFLFMFGCPRADAAKKQQLADEKKAEKAYLKRLENGLSENDYRAAREVLAKEIDALERRRRIFESDPEFEKNLAERDSITVEMGRIHSQLSQIDVRMGLIREACNSFDDARSEVDVDQIRELYREASRLMPDLQKRFEDLIDFHNGMIEERKQFILGDLPDLERHRAELTLKLENLVERERELGELLIGSITSDEFEELIVQVNEKYRQLGEYDSHLKQIAASKKRIEDIGREIDSMDSTQGGAFEEKLKAKVDAFNQIFSKVSKELYGESYIAAFEKKRDRSGTSFYDFHTVNVGNVSSGKKQGEILCFDVAYTSFADAEGIDCLHFVLNDKKELLHGNQLYKISQLAKEQGIQVVISMLHDKLPEGLSSENYVILRLSQDDKLFRIERYANELH